jgi:hypothetical protein
VVAFKNSRTDSFAKTTLEPWAIFTDAHRLQICKMEDTSFMNIPEMLLVTTRLQEKECGIQPPLPIHILDFDPFSNIPSRLGYAIEMLQDVKGSCCMSSITIPFWYRKDIFAEATPVSAGIPTDTVLFNSLVTNRRKSISCVEMRPKRHR